MTPWEERDAQTVEIIRREINKASLHKDRCGYLQGSLEEVALRYEILGMRRILALLDPNPHL
jgi:hypothetical protein